MDILKGIPSGNCVIRTETGRQENRDGNVRGCRQQKHVGRPLLFDETDYSPQSATGNTYDWNRPTDGIIFLVENEAPRTNTRREIHVEADMEEVFPLKLVSQRNIRKEVHMNTVQQKSTKSITTPSVYDGSRRKDEDDDVRAMENS